MIEIVIVGALFMFVLFYTRGIDTNKFIQENDLYIKMLKEKDYDFYVMAKYGETADPNAMFMKRLKTSFITLILLLIFVITQFSFINFVFVLVISFLIYKSGYTNLKSYYKKYMHQVDSQLPYYLKGLEILCQNYTVPVALSRSIEDAPDIFKPGLRDMVARIDAGDSSIQPYMDFAIQYPVRDSMRMMRLLYRLGLGAQENKYQQLLLFSRSVSSLQQKAREDKYKARLDNMDRRTMIMLVVTGGGSMLILLLALVTMF